MKEDASCVVCTIALILFIVGLTILSSGCASIKPPDYQYSVAQANANARAEIAMWRSISAMRSSEAQLATGLAIVLSRRSDADTSDYEAYARAVASTNRSQAMVAGKAMTVAGVVGAIWANGKAMENIANSSGGSITSNTVQGDGNSTGGRNSSLTNDTILDTPTDLVQ